jgi:iron complex transport system substrate-binding protein
MMKRKIEAPGFILPGIEDITRRDFLIGGAAVILLGGCGGNGGQNSSSGETRPFTHAAGTTQVPVSPKRIAALLDAGVTHNLLDLEAPLIASCGEDGRIQVDDHDVSEIAFLGSADQPNLERLAALEPDLIIGLTFQQGLYDRLSGIAPTVILDYGSSVPLIDYERRLADLVNRLPQFERLMEQVDRRTGELQEELAPIVAELEVSALSGSGAEGIFTYYGPGIAYSVAFERLAVSMPRDMPPSFDEVGEYFSRERLPDFDADVLFLMDDGGSDFDSLQDEPLFQSLNATRKDQVFVVDYATWTASRLSAMLSVLDDIEKYLIGREIDTSGDFR